MSEELLINVSTLETRVALVAHGALQELHIARASGYSATGNIYLGKVVRIIPGMQAAFVDIGLERPGFLHARDIAEFMVMAAPDRQASESKNIRDLLHDGQQLLVQVERDPISAKGAKLSTRLSLAAKFLVLTPRSCQIGISQRIDDAGERGRLFSILEPLIDASGMGVIARTLSAGTNPEAMRGEYDALIASWRSIEGGVGGATAPKLLYQELPVQQRLVRDLVGPATSAIFVDNQAVADRLADDLTHLGSAHETQLHVHEEQSPIFDRHGIEQEINLALEPSVRLPRGGTLVIEQTESMVCVDVNTASFLGSKSLEETVFQTNLEAAKSIPRQLRLRNLGGIIVIDFIDMQLEAHREQVMQALVEAFSEDPCKVQIDGFSALGLVQLTRKRTRSSLAQTLCEPCLHCEGNGWVKSAESTAAEIFRELMLNGGGEEKGARGEVEILVSASPHTVDYLTQEVPDQVNALGDLLGCKIRVEVELLYEQGKFDIALLTRTPNPGHLM